MAFPFLSPFPPLPSPPSPSLPFPSTSIFHKLISWATNLPPDPSTWKLVRGDIPKNADREASVSAREKLRVLAQRVWEVCEQWWQKRFFGGGLDGAMPIAKMRLAKLFPSFSTSRDLVRDVYVWELRASQKRCLHHSWSWRGAGVASITRGGWGARRAYEFWRNRLVDWKSVGRLVRWSIGRLVVWSVFLPAGRLAGWLVGHSLVGW